MNAARAVPDPPRVLIAVAHPMLGRLILELLDREHDCWNVRLVDGAPETAAHEFDPDLVVVDGTAFLRCRREQLPGYPRIRIVVIASDPDPAYRVAALRHGANGWVASDNIAEQLPSALRSALVSIHGRCLTPAAPNSRPTP